MLISICDTKTNACDGEGRTDHWRPRTRAEEQGVVERVTKKITLSELINENMSPKCLHTSAGEDSDHSKIGKSVYM